MNENEQPEAQVEEAPIQAPTRDQVAQAQAQLDFNNEVMSIVTQQRNNLLQQVAEQAAMVSILRKQLAAVTEVIQQKGLAAHFESLGPKA